MNPSRTKPAGMATAAVAFACVLLAACASIPPSPGTAARTGEPTPPATPAVAGIQVANGTRKVNGGFYVVLRKTGADFQLASVAGQRPAGPLDAGTELLVFDESLGVVQPAYDSYELEKRSGNFRCSRAFGDRKKAYTPCASDLAKTVDLNVGGNVLAGVLTGGLTVLAGARTWEAQTDDALLRQIVAQPGFVEQVRAQAATIARERWLRAYRQSFEATTTVSAVDAFTSRYAKEDPDDLVPKAKDKRRLLEYREHYARSNDVAALQAFALRYQRWDPEGLVPKARARATELAAVAARRQAEEKREAAARRASPAAPTQGRKDEDERDAAGRRIVRGPVYGGFYNNVHIISSSVGIAGENISVMNSVIEAPVCIRTSGMGLRVQGSELQCNVCVEFTGSLEMDNMLVGNSCHGTAIVRPAF